jgi:hypothetical protein
MEEPDFRVYEARQVYLDLQAQHLESKVLQVCLEFQE